MLLAFHFDDMARFLAEGNDAGNSVLLPEHQGNPVHDGIVICLAGGPGTTQQQMDVVAHQNEGVDGHIREACLEKGQAVLPTPSG